HSGWTSACRRGGLGNTRFREADGVWPERPSWRKLADRNAEIIGEPARLGLGVGEIAEQPTVRASKCDPAIAVAFAADADGVGQARRKAQDQNGIESSRSSLRGGRTCTDPSPRCDWSSASGSRIRTPCLVSPSYSNDAKCKVTRLPVHVSGSSPRFSMSHLAFDKLTANCRSVSRKQSRSTFFLNIRTASSRCEMVKVWGPRSKSLTLNRPPPSSSRIRSENALMESSIVGAG